MLFVLISEAGVWPPEIRGPFDDRAHAEAYIASLALPNSTDMSAEIIETQRP